MICNDLKEAGNQVKNDAYERRESVETYKEEFKKFLNSCKCGICWMCTFTNIKGEINAKDEVD